MRHSDQVVLDINGSQGRNDGSALSEFAFLPSDASLQGDYNVSGEMQSTKTDSAGPGGYSKNAASAFLESKGFGWLLETEMDDVDYKTPILDELEIDVKDIFYKVRCVLLPLPYFRLKIQLVRDHPDFWGPLAVVLCYALLSLYGQLEVVSWILTIWFVGSFVIYFLGRSLGGEVNFSQCLGVIGYCLIPLVLTAGFLPLFKSWHPIASAVKIFGVAWAVYSAGSLLCSEELNEKRPLLLYPIFLLYVYFFSLHTGA